VVHPNTCVNIISQFPQFHHIMTSSPAIVPYGVFEVRIYYEDTDHSGVVYHVSYISHTPFGWSWIEVIVVGVELGCWS
jgi:hypothetical protein